MRSVPPRRSSGTTGRHAAGGLVGDAKLRHQLAQDPAFRVLTVDGLNWVDPYSGTVVPAPFGFEEPALAWLRQHQPWKRDGQEVAAKPLAELQFIRWVHYLKAHLPEPELGWLRQFLPDGRWLNPFTGQPVAGIMRDNGRITMDTVRQLAAVLRDCPPAQNGKPLDREILATRLRQLAPQAPTARAAPAAQPVAPLAASPRTQPAVPPPPAPVQARKEQHPRPAPESPHDDAGDALDGDSTGALVPPAGREPPTRSTTRAARGGEAKKSTQPATEPSVRLVSGYRILGTLGMGGMSTVYRAVQLSMEREVALKVLDQQGPPDPAYTERFVREARSVGRISHPNVVTCYDVGVHHGNRLYMALELVTGGDATQLADRHGGRLPERIAMGILRDAARGLGAIHAAGLIHRDIKPANLFIAADGQAKLGDLGLARDTNATAEKYRTVVGIAVGTPAFMSPEQAQGAKDLDIRSDIHALGASIYALLAGRPPYEAENAFDLAQKIISGPVPDIRLVRPDLSPVAAAALTKAMAKDRSARQQTPQELQQAAEDALSRVGTAQHERKDDSGARATLLPPGIDKLRAGGYRVAEVRGKGLIATLGLGGSVLCVAIASGTLTPEQAKEHLDRRLRQYLAALRAPAAVGQPEATPSSLCRALLVDGLSAAVAQVELAQKALTIGCTPNARAALANAKDAHVLTEVSSSPVAIPFPPASLVVLAAGLTGKPFALWGTLVARCDQGAEAFAAHIPLTAEGSTILVLGADG